MADARREHHRTRRRDPYVGTSSTTSDLYSGGGGESIRKASQDKSVSSNVNAVISPGAEDLIVYFSNKVLVLVTTSP